jgi:peptide/nickel transport system permease protein
MGMAGLGILVFFVLVAIFAPLLASREALSATCPCNGVPFSPPSLQFPFGTDDLGRSVLALTIWGTRISLLVGLIATIISMALGTIVGITAAYYAGKTDTVLNSVTNWILVIPFLPLAIVLSVVIFIVIPDRAFTYLSKHVVPLARDAILLTWMVVVFFAMCWLFVRLQSGRRR